MSLTADQAYNLWKGTPYEAELNKYVTYQTYQQGDFIGDGYESSPGGYVWQPGKDYSGLSSYIQGQEQFKAQQAANPAQASMMINYSQFSDDPAKVTAELTRKQWADYQARFVPTENRLMNMASYMNPSVVSNEINSAIGQGGYVNRAIDNSSAQTQRSFARYGLSPNAAQQTALDRDTSLTRSKAVVDAANRIRTSIMDRNQQIAIGAVPNAGRAYGLKVEE